MLVITFAQLFSLGIVFFDNRTVLTDDVCSTPSRECVTVSHDTFAIFGVTCVISDHCGVYYQASYMTGSNMFDRFMLCYRRSLGHLRSHRFLYMNYTVSSLLNRFNLRPQVSVAPLLLTIDGSHEYMSPLYADICMHDFKICNRIDHEQGHIYSFTTFPKSLYRFGTYQTDVAAILDLPYGIPVLNSSMQDDDPNYQDSDFYIGLNSTKFCTTLHAAKKLCSVMGFIPCVEQKLFHVTIPFAKGSFWMMVGEHIGPGAKNVTNYGIYLLASKNRSDGGYLTMVETTSGALIKKTFVKYDDSTMDIYMRPPYEGKDVEIHFTVANVIYSFRMPDFVQRSFVFAGNDNLEMLGPIRICGLYDIDVPNFSDKQISINETHFIRGGITQLFPVNYLCATSISVVTDFMGILSGFRMILHILVSALVSVLIFLLDRIADFIYSLEDVFDLLFQGIFRFLNHLISALLRVVLINDDLLVFFITSSVMYTYFRDWYVTILVTGFLMVARLYTI